MLGTCTATPLGVGLRTCGGGVDRFLRGPRPKSANDMQLLMRVQARRAARPAPEVPAHLSPQARAGPRLPRSVPRAEGGRSVPPGLTGSACDHVRIFSSRRGFFFFFARCRFTCNRVRIWTIIHFPPKKL